MSVAIKVGRMGSQGGVPIGRNVPQGDPGLFGSIFGGLKKIATSFIPKPIRTVSNVLGLTGQQGPGVSAPRGQPLTGGRAARERIFPGGETGLGTGCPSGHRPNKSDYFLRDGTFIAAGTRCVKNRRRNPANARATSRAISRINGAKRMQHTLAQIETGKFTKAGKHKHHTHS